MTFLDCIFWRSIRIFILTAVAGFHLHPVGKIGGIMGVVGKLSEVGCVGELLVYFVIILVFLYKYAILREGKKFCCNKCGK